LRGSVLLASAIFVDEGFAEEAVLREVDAAPEAHRDGRFAPGTCDAKIFDSIGKILFGKAMHHGLIDPPRSQLGERLAAIDEPASRTRHPTSLPCRSNPAACLASTMGR